MKELINEIRDMKRQLVDILDNKVIVETNHAYNINATNNIINNVATADIFGRA